jgi:hypothetical protein
LCGLHLDTRRSASPESHSECFLALQEFSARLHSLFPLPVGHSWAWPMQLTTRSASTDSSLTQLFHTVLYEVLHPSCCQHTDRATQDLKSLVKFQVGAVNCLVQHSDAFCLTDPSCPFHGQGNGTVIKVYLYAPPLT